MWQQSTRFHKIQSLGSQLLLSRTPVESREPFVRTFARPFATPSCNVADACDKTRHGLSVKLAASRRRRGVPIAPLTALIVTSLHRCRSARHPSLARAPATAEKRWHPSAARRASPRPRAQLRARQSPVRLQSRTTVHETATLTRRRDDALSRNAQDAQGPEQAPAKISPKTSVSQARSGV